MEGDAAGFVVPSPRAAQNLRFQFGGELRLPTCSVGGPRHPLVGPEDLGSFHGARCSRETTPWSGGKDGSATGRERTRLGCLEFCVAKLPGGGDGTWRGRPQELQRPQGRLGSGSRGRTTFTSGRRTHDVAGCPCLRNVSHPKEVTGGPTKTSRNRISWPGPRRSPLGPDASLRNAVMVCQVSAARTRRTA